MEGGQEDGQPEVQGGDQDQEEDHEALQEVDLQPPPKRLCLEYFGALEAVSSENSRWGSHINKFQFTMHLFVKGQ